MGQLLVRYPGIPNSAIPVTTGFPDWLRLLHFLNLFFMAFIIRAGVQILAIIPTRPASAPFQNEQPRQVRRDDDRVA